MVFQELCDLFIYAIRRHLTKDLSGVVPKEVDKLVRKLDYGHEILPEFWTDGKYLVYIPEEGDSSDICWQEISELPKEVAEFVLSYHSLYR